MHARMHTRAHTHTTWPPSFGQQMWQCQCCAKQPGPDVWPGLSSSQTLFSPFFPHSPVLSSSPPPCLFSADDPPLLTRPPIPPSFASSILIILPSLPFSLLPLSSATSDHLPSLIPCTCPPFPAPIFHSPPPLFNVPFFIIFSEVSACILLYIIFSVLALLSHLFLHCCADSSHALQVPFDLK